MEQPVQPMKKLEFQEEPKLSFVERHNIHPFLFATVVLVCIFLLYQIGGGFLSLYMSSVFLLPLLHPTVVRWSAVIGQTIFIFLPTILFAKLLSTNLCDVFPMRVPKLKESTFGLLSLLALQWICEIYSALQDLIPLPVFIEEFFQPLKQMLMEMTKAIATANSIPELIVVLCVVAIVPAIIEETLFRGLIQRSFEHVITPFTSAVLSGAIFGIFHLNPFDVIPLIGIGIFLGILRYRSGTMLLPIAAHFLNNAISIFAIYMGYDDESSLAASGGSTSIPFLLLQLVFVGLIFYFTFRIYLNTTRTVQENNT